MSGPIDLTTLNNLTPNLDSGDTADPELRKAAFQYLYGYAGGLYEEMNGLISAGTLSRLGIINVKDYGASGSAETYTASIAAGSRNLVLTTSSHDFVAGQGISIPGAGAAGAALVTTVSAVSGATVTVATAASTAATGVTVKHDDGVAIQAALKYCFDNDKNLIGSPGTYPISGTIYLPSNQTFGKQFFLDFSGMTFQVADGVTLFESGKFSSGEWVSTYGEALDTTMSFGVTLKGFVIQGGAVGIKIANWHQGCTILDISSRHCATVVDAKNCYYTSFDNIKTVGEEVVPLVDTRFKFSNNCNVMNISRCSAANSAIGYLFSGPVTATKFTNNSVEGCTTGVKFTSTVYDIAITDNYIENIDVAGRGFDFTDVVFGAKFSNNYFNFMSEAWYAIKHFSNAVQNIIVDESNNFTNMIDNSYIFENKGYGFVTLRERPRSGADLSSLDVDQSLYPTSSIYEKKVLLSASVNGPIANVVKDFVVGNYSGRMTQGNAVDALYGMTVINNVGGSVSLQTRIKYQSNQLLFVSFKCVQSPNTTFKAMGFFADTTFYEFTPTGIQVTTNLSLNTSGAYIVINTTALNTGGNPAYIHQSRGGEARVL